MVESSAVCIEIFSLALQQVLISRLEPSGDGQQCRYGVQQDLEAKRPEFLWRQKRRLTVFDDIGDKRHASECFGDAAKFFLALRCLNEKNIGAG